MRLIKIFIKDIYDKYEKQRIKKRNCLGFFL